MTKIALVLISFFHFSAYARSYECFQLESSLEELGEYVVEISTNNRSQGIEAEFHRPLIKPSKLMSLYLEGTQKSRFLARRSLRIEDDRYEISIPWSLKEIYDFPKESEVIIEVSPDKYLYRLTDLVNDAVILEFISAVQIESIDYDVLYEVFHSSSKTCPQGGCTFLNKKVDSLTNWDCDDHDD